MAQGVTIETTHPTYACRAADPAGTSLYLYLEWTEEAGV